MELLHNGLSPGTRRLARGGFKMAFSYLAKVECQNYVSNIMCTSQATDYSWTFN